jgi:hypothetical protein
MFADVSPSYGNLFVKSLLRAASLGNVALVTPTLNVARPPDRLTDKVLNMRDNTTGLNVDFISYALYARMGFDPIALRKPQRVCSH